VAAVVLMLVTPQDVPGVSFQMSFSAVLALISGYEALRPRLSQLRGERSSGRRFALHVLALALTSLLAGGASAPFAAYHFGQVQVYFVLANVLAVPLTALLVMPAGLLALALMPFGLEWLALLPMGLGCEAILWVARTVSALPAATWLVPHMPLWGLGAVALGMAWLGIWRTLWRLAGIAVIAVGLLSPALQRPPDILVSDEARLIGVRTASGVFLQAASGASRITREAWLRYWAVTSASGIPSDGVVANGAITCAKDACLLRPREAAKPGLLLRGAEQPDFCAEASVIVSAEPARGRCPRPYPALVDRFTVWRQGAAAIWLEPDGAIVLTDREDRGSRPWVAPLPLPRQQRAPNLPMAPAQSER
jgi:competence protein ComEC